MMKEKILTRIIDWANEQENIRMVVMDGSLARGTYIDELSDIDINLFIKSNEPFLKNDSWMSEISNVWIFSPGMFMIGEKTVPTRYVIFENAIKVDFSFLSLDLMQDIIDGIVTHYETSYKILIDKDGKGRNFPKPVLKVNKIPLEKEYLTLVNEFWFKAYHVAKYLKRDEFWFVKSWDWEMKNLSLLKMLEWHEQVKHNWNHNTYYMGKHIKQWLDAEIYQQLRETFTGSEIKENWNALFITLDLFRKLAINVADRLGFKYSNDTDKNMTNVINEIYESD